MANGLPDGKISLIYTDTDGKQFTESPFYTNANFMTQTPLPNQPSINRATAMSRLSQALADMNSLTTGNFIKAKVIYECDIED